MKRPWFFVCLALLLLLAPGVLAGTADLWNGLTVARVVINGQELNSDVPAVILDGRTVLPVRAVAEALGADVKWDPATFTVSIKTNGGQHVTAPTPTNRTWKGYQVVRVYVNGKEVQSDVPAIILEGRTVLPTRAVAEAVGAQVSWDPASYTALISTSSSNTNTSAGTTQSDSSCAFIQNGMAIQTDRIIGMVNRSLETQVWGHVVQFWSPILKQQNCPIPQSRTVLGVPVRPRDSLECAQTRAAVEERRRDDIQTVSARLAANGTLSGSPAVDLLWEVNLQWDIYLLQRGCNV